VFKTLEDNWLAVTAAGVALGAGLMKLTGRSHELNEGIRSTAAITGETEEELRDMTIALSDATLSNDDVVASMERLVQKGFETKEEFEAMIPVFDDFADATGKDIVESIDLFDNVLGALGIPLEDAGQHIDTMTHIVERTDIPLGTLQRNLARVPEELQALEFGMEEAAAGIEYFRDQGYSGQEAVREFRRAVEESEGDMEAFMEITGMTSEEFEKYQEEIAGAEGLTQELADINNQSLGIWDNLKARLDDAMLSFGTYLEPVKDAGPLMMALGPAIKGVSMAKGAFATASGIAATAARGFGLAVRFALGPVGLIITAIGLAVTAGWYLYNNWDEVAEFVTDLWQKFSDWFMELWDGITAFILGWWDAYWGFWQSSWEGLREWFYGLWNGITGWLTDSLNEVAGIWERTWERISNFFSGIWEGIRDTFFGIWNALISGLESGINFAISGVNSYIRYINRAIRQLNRVPRVSIPTVPELGDVSIPRLAEGGDILRGGAALVGEQGPELLDLPAGAQVRPLQEGTGTGGVTFERGAFEGAFILDDYGVDRLMERVVGRLRDETGLAF